MRLDLLFHLYLFMVSLFLMKFRSQADKFLRLLRLVMAFSRFSFACPLFVVQLGSVSLLISYAGGQEGSYSSPVEFPPSFHAISQLD